MFHEYRDLVTELKGKNARFTGIFDRHNEIDQRIKNIEEGREHADQYEIETLKKEKLRLKDEAYLILMEYKKQKES